MASLDSFKCRKKLTVGAKTYEYFSLKAAEKNGLAGISQLPFSMKIVLENLLRNEDGRTVKKEDIEAVAAWLDNRGKTRTRDRLPPGARADAGFHRRAGRRRSRRDARRDGQARRRSRTRSTRWCRSTSSSTIRSSSTIPAPRKSLGQNVKREYEQNQERYRFLKWGQQAFSNFSVVPPGTGICHQVNLEYLAQTVWTAKEKRDGKTVEIAYPDTLVGTDSHTTMVNGLAVLGWGVGGIEAEAAMLGQPLSMLLPEVIGFKLTGELREGVTATDLVLTVTQMLRKKGVVGKFVEFFGPGLNAMSVADRATLANMAPEYGATCGLFPIDAQALAYLKTSGRKPSRIDLVEAYAKAQGTLPHAPDARSGVHRHARAQSRRGRALARRPEAPAGPRGARRGQGRLRRRDDDRVQAGRRDRRAPQGRGDELRSRPRRRRDRRDHLLHQHLEPERDDRGRASSRATRSPRA